MGIKLFIFILFCPYFFIFAKKKNKARVIESMTYYTAKESYVQIEEEKKDYSSLLLSRKVNKNPLTMRRATGLGIQRHSRPSTYATIPDNTNLPIPHLQMNRTFCFSSGLFSRVIAF